MGAYSRNKGAATERELAAYLRQWWPTCVRAVRTGSSAAPDPGDLANVPFIVSVKNHAKATAPGLWQAWWAELDEMRVDDPAALAWIAEKRPGHSDPGMWWAHLHLTDLIALARPGLVQTTERDRTPVRLQLEHLVELLVASNYARQVPA